MRSIIVQFTFEGVHHWPDCDIPGVLFLRDKHRHIFHVKAVKKVEHNDRDVEIIMLKRDMEKFVKKAFFKPTPEAAADLGSLSCEALAEIFIEEFDLDACQVLEDGENGAYLVVSSKESPSVVSFPPCSCHIRPGLAVVVCPACKGILPAKNPEYL